MVSSSRRSSTVSPSSEVSCSPVDLVALRRAGEERLSGSTSISQPSWLMTRPCSQGRSSLTGAIQTTSPGKTLLCSRSIQEKTSAHRHNRTNAIL
jgi:hypothetical protein